MDRLAVGLKVEGGRDDIGDRGREVVLRLDRLSEETTSTDDESAVLSDREHDVGIGSESGRDDIVGGAGVIVEQTGDRNGRVAEAGYIGLGVS